MAGGMTPDEHKALSAAVAAAEAGTDGEIVTILAERSDDYIDMAWAWSAIVGLIALAAYVGFPALYTGLVDRVTGGWVERDPAHYLWLIFVLVALKMAGTRLLLEWRPLRLALTPRAIKAARVRARAVLLFKVGAERRTAGMTGILIYLSLAERRAEIVADSAIAAKVAPEKWGDAMADLLVHVAKGQTGAGLVAAVRDVGAILHEHVPATGGNPNELPDRLIEL